jgi:putative flippase GtrA
METKIQETAEKTPLKHRWYIQFLKFTCFSLGAALIDMGSFALMALVMPGDGEPYYQFWLIFRTIVSVVLSCAFNVTLNRKATFKTSNIKWSTLALYAAFYAAFLLFDGWFVPWLTLDVIGNPDLELLSKFISMVLNFVLEFLFYKFILFRKPRNKGQGIGNEDKIGNGEQGIADGERGTEAIEGIGDNQETAGGAADR